MTRPYYFIVGAEARGNGAFLGSPRNVCISNRSSYTRYLFHRSGGNDSLAQAHPHSSLSAAQVRINDDSSPLEISRLRHYASCVFLFLYQQTVTRDAVSVFGSENKFFFLSFLFFSNAEAPFCRKIFFTERTIIYPRRICHGDLPCRADLRRFGQQRKLHFILQRK